MCTYACTGSYNVCAHMHALDYISAHIHALDYIIYVHICMHWIIYVHMHALDHIIYVSTQACTCMYSTQPYIHT